MILGIGGGTVINPSGYTQSVTPIRIQFTIGQSGMNGGDTVYTIPYACLPSSMTITLQGLEVPQNVEFDFSYTVVFGSNATTITFNQGVPDNQYMVIDVYKINV